MNEERRDRGDGGAPRRRTRPARPGPTLRSSRPPAAPRPRRRRIGAAPPIARFGSETEMELDVRVHPGDEAVAVEELAGMGAAAEVRGRGELRVTVSGPLRALLLWERPLAVYVVRPLPGMNVRQLGGDVAREAAVELAAIVANLAFKGKLKSYRVTAGPDVAGDRSPLGKLAGNVGRRLGLAEAAISPDLVLIVRTRPGGLEMAARLPSLSAR